jgi:hypothetical protein
MSKFTTLTILTLTILFCGCFSFDKYCEHGGLPDRQEIQYYRNKNVRMIGTIKNCYWDGEVKYYYENGELQHVEKYKGGVRHGLFQYYSTSGQVYKTENYINDTLKQFTALDEVGNSNYEFGNGIIAYNAITKPFHKPTTLFGNDHPLLSIIDGNLHLRGRYDYYVIKRALNVKLNLRDTLLKYIPSAYTRSVDESGNTHVFDWHRDLTNDSLKVKVFYEFKSGSSTKEWQRTFSIK